MLPVATNASFAGVGPCTTQQHDQRVAERADEESRHHLSHAVGEGVAQRPRGELLGDELEGYDRDRERDADDRGDAFAQDGERRLGRRGIPGEDQVEAARPRMALEAAEDGAERGERNGQRAGHEQESVAQLSQSRACRPSGGAGHRGAAADGGSGTDAGVG
jgi:hypothetical protein